MPPGPSMREPSMPVSPLLLLSNQFIFMLGFYMVVPFLAIFMRQDLGMESVAIGLVLGIRTFAQQGLFIVGGAFADRLGARRLILLGCATRIVGFLVLAAAQDFVVVMLGALLTGLAGALFSPAISSLAAKVGDDQALQGKRTRAQFFAMLAVWGELGAVVGPLAGAVLLGIGFHAMALSGAVIFTLAFVILFLKLPRSDLAVSTTAGRAWWQVFEDRLFLAFTLAHCGFLFSYNQLYFALPVEIARVGGTETDLAPLFMVASVMVVTLQLPIANLAQRMGWVRSLSCGFALMAAAFAVVAWSATIAPADNLFRLAPATAMVVLLILGQMLVRPIAMDIVPRFAAGRPTGIYYGAIASAGGLAVLLGNVLIGPSLELALETGPRAAWPWLALAVVPAMGAVAIIPIARTLYRRSVA